MPSAESTVRDRLMVAAIGLIREHGLAGLTQPRVAKAAGISQSHLTYYFPTRQALLNAVLERAAEGQLAGLKRAFATADNGSRALAEAIGAALGQPENSRLLAAFLLAADQDPAARRIFSSLVAGMRGEIAVAAAKIGVARDSTSVALIHALGTGLAVLNLALGDALMLPKPAKSIAALFKLLADRKSDS